MIAEAFTLLVAIAVPIVCLSVVVGLIAGLGQLERSRDELTELRGK